MPEAANRAKTKWNAANYAQVKAYVDPGVASAFKAACGAACASMNSVLTQFMADYCRAQSSGQAESAGVPSTKRKRRARHNELLRQLVQLRDEQERANGNVHENFRCTEAYGAAEESVLLTDEAIDLLRSVYWC